MSTDLPGTSLDAPSADGGPHDVYQALLAESVLGFQACASCTGVVFPPRGRCPHCGADALAWRASAGRGAVYSATVLSPREAPPYAIVLVDLDEGHRMMSRMAAAADVRIDDRVLVQFEPNGDGVLPMFVPEEGAR